MQITKSGVYLCSYSGNMPVCYTNCLIWQIGDTTTEINIHTKKSHISELFLDYLMFRVGCSIILLGAAQLIRGDGFTRLIIIVEGITKFKSIFCFIERVCPWI